MKYAVSELAEIIEAQFLNKEVVQASIDEIFFDTRKGYLAEEALFIAIEGANSDGHNHIHDAYHNLHVRNFLVTKRIRIDEFPDANFLICSNIITSIQALAKHHRRQYKLPVIGITGSNGKTIVKEWIYQLGEEHFRIARSPGSYNSQLGVPLSVLKLEAFHELGIFEAGISHEDEMVHLEQIIQPKIGVFTNIGEAHSAGFESKLQKLEEKLFLFENCETIIYCMDDGEVERTIKSKFDSSRLLSWSMKNKSAAYFISAIPNEDEVVLDFHCLRAFKCTIPFSDEISIRNACSAIISCLVMGIEPEQIARQSRGLKSIKMRLEIKNGINNCLLINDSYNSDLNALNSALNILNQQKKKSKNTLILSQIEESNLPTHLMIESLVRILEDQQIHRIIAVGEGLKGLQEKVHASILLSYFKTTQELLKQLDSLHLKNENILIKGARRFNLEQVFELLSTKVHQTILQIDLEAMRHNLSVFRSFLRNETKLMVMLKAAGYGSGSKELARFLSYQRVDYIAVAYVDEGIELRKEGIELPIMVMNPEESGFSQMIKYDLEPEIYSLEQLKQFTNYVNDSAYPIHLKIETGMNRLGFDRADLAELCTILGNSDAVKVKSIFSHLVGSEDEKLDTFSKLQIQRFNVAYEFIIEKINYRPLRHILNSNGISRFTDHQFEMVRLGIGLHGISDDNALKHKLQKVQTLKTRIAQIKEVSKGESVGYSRKFQAMTNYRIATINIGYADGLPRNAGTENFSVLVGGKEAAILGNVCMDMCMINVTDLDCKVGDEVVIFGKTWPIENLAKKCGTIPYEILTRLSHRIHRIFSRE